VVAEVGAIIALIIFGSDRQRHVRFQCVGGGSVVVHVGNP
jgi:hypothetical protein